MINLTSVSYIEDTGQPLYYREAPLNGIWEGSGNVICLDILRTLAKEPLAADMLRNELDAATGSDWRYDLALKDHRERWPSLPPESEARWFAERVALLLTASVLIRSGVGDIADAYVATRLTNERGHVTGAISEQSAKGVLERVMT